MDLVKKIIAFALAIGVSLLIFYSFFALFRVTFRIIFDLFYIAVIVLVALPFYVLIKRKLLK